MRPALRAGLPLLWRDQDTIQIGSDPRRAAAVTGVTATAGLLALLDGSRDRARFIDAAAGLGVPAATAERMLTLLAGAGLLVDFPAGTLRAMPAELRRLLAPELAGASLARMDGDGGGQVLARRSAATVVVRGTGPVPALIADALTASGVAAARGPAAASDGTVAAAGGSAPGGQPPTLAVLVGRHPPEPVTDLLRRGVPHLAVSAEEAIGTVGPLVRPGSTTCLRCLDLARTDHDPAWPLILAQLAGRQPDPPACDAVLTLAVAGQASGQVLHFIDQPGTPGPAEGATLELTQPGWQWRRRAWKPHPACLCRASSAA